MEKRTAGILSVQFRPKLGNKAANLEKVKELISSYSGKELDLILVPEFFTTGLCHKTMMEEPEDVNGGETVKVMSELAKQYNTNIACGSVIEKDGDKLYNTCFVLDRKGEIIAKYRKIHLFDYMGGTEGERITAGDKTVVVETDFAKIGLSICFDIRYPMHYRKLIEQGAEIITCPTAWAYPNSLSDDEKATHIDIWCSMNKTRAVENLCYFVSADMCGKVDSFFSSSGNSMITHPSGYVMQNAGDEEKAIYAQIDLDVVRELKKTYPVADIV